ncbi:MAG: arginine repressor [Clostridia bacterium]
MKHKRQNEVIRIIENYSIETQDELADKLREAGMDVTQATVSRDIKELRLTKVQIENGRYKYAPFSKASSNTYERLLKVFSEAFLMADYASNTVVVKTLSGMANAAASAIDAMNWPFVLGCIAGDDTIMILCRTTENAEELVRKFDIMALR